MTAPSLLRPAIDPDETEPTPQSPHPEARNPSSARVAFDNDAAPLKLDCGQALSPFEIAYQTYGALNADKSNAILICHALTGDQHV
ncbi:MAG: hypothetical protein AAFY27_11610, partial [Pseudomonadota bacterium]